MSLKDVEKYARVEFVIHNKGVYFEKNRKNNKYIIKAGKNTYEFDNYKSAINANIVKSSYDQWLTLKDLNKIAYYKDKINEIELQGLIIGDTIFVDDLDIKVDYNYDDESDDGEIKVIW